VAGSLSGFWVAAGAIAWFSRFLFFGGRPRRFPVVTTAGAAAGCAKSLFLGGRPRLFPVVTTAFLLFSVIGLMPFPVFSVNGYDHSPPSAFYFILSVFGYPFSVLCSQFSV
jgi:hypothetical protein